MTPRTESRCFRACVCLPYAALAITAMLAGCTISPQEALKGRWYNDATSIRFRPDGTLIYNSAATGLVTGRYYFDDDVRPEASAAPVANLTLDLALASGVERWQLDLRFLGDERLRLQPVNAVRRGRPSDGVAKVLILRKADAAGTESLAAAR